MCSDARNEKDKKNPVEPLPTISNKQTTFLVEYDALKAQVSLITS